MNKKVTKEETLFPGLYLVATPIGSSRDITLRALDVIQSSDVIIAEDTRIARRLMSIHNIGLKSRNLISYNDANGSQKRPMIINLLNEGNSVCFLSDAGSPLIADPGMKLVQDALDNNILIQVVPGPSSVIAALSVAGLPTDKFMFAGFIPSQDSARESFLIELVNVQATLVLFETARRLTSSLIAIRDKFGSKRRVAICRELTKKFEEVWRGNIAELATKADQMQPKGEIVILIDRQEILAPSTDIIDQHLRIALSKMSLRDSVLEVSQALGAKRRDVYQIAISIQEKKSQ